LGAVKRRLFTFFFLFERMQLRAQIFEFRSFITLRGGSVVAKMPANERSR